MRRCELRSLIPRLLASAALAFSGCTGTSTESENTLGLVPGRALHAEGTPASGARITLRSRELVAAGWNLSWKVLATATADRQGRFELRLPEGEEVFLEILEADPAGSHPGIHFIRFDSAEARPRSLGDLALAPSGTLEGRLTPRPGAPTGNLWVGVAGTSALVLVPGVGDSAGTPFRLEGLPAGQHALTVALAGGLGSGPDKPPPRVTVAADTLTDAGQVYFEEVRRVFLPAPP